MIAYDLHTIKAHPLAIRRIVLTNQSLRTLPSEIRSCVYLRELDLQQNQIVDLPPWIAELSDLQTVNLKTNQLTIVPAAVFKLPSLSWLNLSHNQIRKWETQTSIPSTLLHLNLSHNAIASIPPNVFEKARLQELFFQYNPLGLFPDLPSSKTSLQTLHLEQTRQKQVPQNVHTYQNLRVLHLAKNQITDRATPKRWPPRLEQLDLSKNQLKTVPKSLKTALYLRTLAINHNLIQQIQLPPLPWLSTLSATANGITTMPDKLTQNNRLASIDLSENPIQHWHQPSSAIYLRHLSLNRCAIRKLPVLPKSLRSLSLRHNPELRYLTFKGSENLKEIDLSYSSFEGFKPIKNQDFQALEELSVYQTPFAQHPIPEQLLEAPNLRKIRGIANTTARDHFLELMTYSRTATLDLQERQSLWAFSLSNNQTDLPTNWLTLRKILRSHYTRLGYPCLELVVDRFGVPPDVRLLQTKGVYFFGKQPVSITQIEGELTALQIPVKESGVWVFGSLPFDLLPANPPKEVMTSSTFFQFLRSIRYTSENHQLTSEDRSSLRHLLWSASPINQQIGLHIISGLSNPEHYLPELIIQWKRTEDANLRKKIRRLLARYLQASDQSMLEHRVLFSRPLPYLAFRQKMIQLTSNISITMVEALDALSEF